MKLSSGYNLGGQQAEADPMLEDAFLRTASVRAAEAKTDPMTFLVGRTGSGKSATLRHIETLHPDHVIRIDPEDLSLPYISDSQIIRTLKAENVHLDPLFIALWKHVLVVEIIRHRYGVYTPEAKQTFFSALLDRILGNRQKTEAFKYLNDFQDKFWCTADLRVREITDQFESSVTDVAGGSASIAGIGTSAQLSDNTKEARATREEWVGKVQRLVNETQLPRLNQMIRVLDEDILDSSQHFTYVLIDDLDRDWVDDSVANDLVRCLFRAVMDLKRVKNLKVLVALRTNIFEVLDFGHKTGGQEEKFRALTLHMRWSRPDLERLLSERVQVASSRFSTDIADVKGLLPATNKTRGNALDFILDRTLMRPRDAISYFNLCLEGATGRPRITWEAIHASEVPYSRGRLLALRDEWKPSFPGIDSVLRKFEACEPVLQREDLESILNEVALLLTVDEMDRSIWLSEYCANLWDEHSHSWSEQYGALTRLLYDIGFLGFLKKLKGGRPIYSHSEPDALAVDSVLDEAEAFVVHPAFRRALDIQHA